MHAVAAEAVAGTVIGLSIRCVPRTKTDEAEGPFALVVSWLPSRPSVSALVSLMASHLQSHHLMLYITNHLAISFFFKSSQVPTCICTFTHSSIDTHTHAFLSLSFLPTIGPFCFVPTMSPIAPDTHLRPGSRPLMTHYSLFISKIGLEQFGLD